MTVDFDPITQNAHILFQLNVLLLGRMAQYLHIQLTRILIRMQPQCTLFTYLRFMGTACCGTPEHDSTALILPKSRDLVTSRKWIDSRQPGHPSDYRIRESWQLLTLGFEKSGIGRLRQKQNHSVPPPGTGHSSTAPLFINRRRRF